MKKSIVTFFAAALLALFLCPVCAVAEEAAPASTGETIVLDRVDVKIDVPMIPQAGAKLSFQNAEVPAGLVLDTGNAYLIYYPDCDGMAGSDYTNGICNGGTRYGVQICVQPLEGYSIADNAAFTLNNQPISKSSIRVVELGDETKYIYRYEFPRTSGSSAVIRGAVINNMPSPIAGKTPREMFGPYNSLQPNHVNLISQVDPGSRQPAVDFAQWHINEYLPGVGWNMMPLDKAFQTGGEYQLYALVDTSRWTGYKIDYTFASSWTLTINGTDFPLTYRPEAITVLRYDFSPVTTISEASATVTAPAMGAKPSFNITVPKDAHYSASVNWVDRTSKQPVTTFGDGFYTSYVTFYADSGYKFVDVLDIQDNVTINGQKALRKAIDPEHHWITFETSFVCGEGPSNMIKHVVVSGVRNAVPGTKADPSSFKLSGSTAEMAYIDPENTYYQRWNPSTKSWFYVNPGETFQEGVHYKVVVGIKANVDASDSERYLLHPNATGEMRSSNVSYAVPAEAEIRTGSALDMAKYVLLLTVDLDDKDCIDLAGHSFTQGRQYYTTCRQCSYLFGDVNRNGSLNVVDAQVAYDLAKGKYKSDADYQKFMARADVSGGSNPREGDGRVEAADAFAIQYAAMRGW